MGINAARNIFFEQIINKIEKGEDIVIVSADLAAPVLDEFRIKYPNRYISVGIAEQNLISVSAGLALEGKKVIAYAANPFLVTRAYDQIRNLVSMMNIPICMVGVGAGLNIPEYGATHYVTEDIAMMNMCPGIVSYNVSDVKMATWLGKNVFGFEKPVYVRFDRLTDVALESEDDFRIGTRVLNQGGKIAIFTTGNLGIEIWKHYKDIILEKNINYVDIYKYPINEEHLESILQNIEKIIVIDESNIFNGLASQVLMILQRKNLKPAVTTIAIDYKNAFPKKFGTRDYFLDGYGLTWKKIEKEIEGK